MSDPIIQNQNSTNNIAMDFELNLPNFEPEIAETKPVSENFSKTEKKEEQIHIPQENKLPENNKAEIKKEDNRLEKEDALLEQKKVQPVERENTIKQIPEIDNTTLNVIEEKKEDIILPVTTETNVLTNSSFEKDQAIIEQIKISTNKKPDIITTGNETIQTEDVDIKTKNTNEINLDEILTTNTNQKEFIPNKQILPQLQNNNENKIPAFTSIHWFEMPPLAEKILHEIKDPLHKKILINIGIGITVFLVGWFMFKTMYPLEYQNLVGNNSETILATNETPEQLWENIQDTWTDDYTSWENSDLFNNPALINYHSSAENNSWSETGFNAFEEIDNELASTTQEAYIEDETVEKIKNYIEEWKKYTVIGQRTNEKEIAKYGLFLYKKSSNFLSDIENKKEITKDELEKQLTDFESYLQKLNQTPTNEETLSEDESYIQNTEEFSWSENSEISENWNNEQEIATENWFEEDQLSAQEWTE